MGSSSGSKFGGYPVKIRMTIKPGVYDKMRKLYGKHVDEIELHSRPIKDKPGKFGYSATCSRHGVVSPWTADIVKRTTRVQMHLKGAHD